MIYVYFVASLIGWFLAGYYSQRMKMLRRVNARLRDRIDRYKQLLNKQYGAIGEEKEQPVEMFDTRCPSRHEELRCQGSRGHSGDIHADIRGLSGPREKQSYVKWNDQGEVQ